MLRVRQLIPPLTLSAASGSMVRAWDFKQKNNLVIAFLDVDCALCGQFIKSLIEHTAALNEKQAVVMLAFSQEPASSLTDPLPPGIVAGVDVDNQGARRYLGNDELSTHGLHRLVIFVTDRYGEISSLWIVSEHNFPAIDEVLRSLESVEMACEECSLPEWPRDE